MAICTKPAPRVTGRVVTLAGQVTCCAPQSRPFRPSRQELAAVQWIPSKQLSCQNFTGLSTNRRIHNAPHRQVLLSANLCQRSTVDTALEISSNEPAMFRLPMSNHKEEGGFVSKRRIIGLIYLAGRLHLRYLYPTRLMKCIVEQFDE
jgi:hypothetical protein